MSLTEHERVMVLYRKKKVYDEIDDMIRKAETVTLLSLDEKMDFERRYLKEQRALMSPEEQEVWDSDGA
jgi:hypothetical protein